MLTWPVSAPALLGACAFWRPGQRLLRHTTLCHRWHTRWLNFWVGLLLCCPCAAGGRPPHSKLEAIDNPKEGGGPHNDRPVSGARGVCASCGQTNRPPSSFPQSPVEDTTTFLYQQEFCHLYLVSQTFPGTFSFYCKYSCLVLPFLRGGAFSLSAPQAASGHPLFRQLWYASVFLLNLETWFPSLLTPSSFSPLPVTWLRFILRGHPLRGSSGYTRLGWPKGDLWHLHSCSALGL